MSDFFGGTIHYRTAFDATCVNPAWTDTYPDLSKRIRTWVEDTLDVPRDTFKTKEFLMGGTFRELCPPRCTFEVVSRKYSTEGFAPNHWGCRITHPCSEFAHRRWVHDLTLTTHPGNRFRIVATSSHSIKGYLGEEPEAPEPFVPGIVLSLITTRHWKCLSGSEVLSSEPVVLSAQFRSLLKNAIINPDRKCPLIYVSVPQNSEVPMVNVEVMARLLCGSAKVYVADSSEADTEIPLLLGEYATWNGGIRVYQAGVNLTSDTDTKRHRFFSPGDIRRYGGDEVMMQIVRACCQRSTLLAPNELLTLESIVSVSRRRRLHELIQGQSQSSEGELIQLAEELEQQLSTVLAENSKFKQELDFAQLELESQAQESEKEIARLQYELKAQIESMQTVFQRLRDLELGVGTVKKLSRLPSTIAEVLALVCDIHADKLICLPEAIKSAEVARFADVFRAWELLWSLAEELYPMMFEEGNDTLFSEKEYENRTGFSISVKEGRMTRRDSKLMRLREREFEGRTYGITPHVGVGSGANCVRVHFAIDRELRKLVIGHCGDHLDTYSTQKLS